MKVKPDENVTIGWVFDDDGDWLDIRVWKLSSSGGAPTRRAITIPKKMLIPMIRALQESHREVSAAEAREKTGVTPG